MVLSDRLLIRAPCAIVQYPSKLPTTSAPNGISLLAAQKAKAHEDCSLVSPGSP